MLQNIRKNWKTSLGGAALISIGVLQACGIIIPGVKCRSRHCADGRRSALAGVRRKDVGLMSGSALLLEALEAPPAS